MESLSEYFNRAILYKKLELDQKAIDNFKEVMKLKPQNPRILNNCALIYESIKNPRLAIANYSKAICLNSNEPAFYCNRGSVHLEKKNYEAAKKDFDKAIELYQRIINRYHSEIQQQHNLIADFFKKESKDDAEFFLTQDPDIMEVDVEKDTLSRIKEIFDQLTSYYQVINQINKQLGLVYFKRSIVFYRLNMMTGAKDDYQKAVELDPELTDAVIKVSNQIEQATAANYETDDSAAKKKKLCL